MLFRKSLLQELTTTAIGAFLILIGIVIAQRTAHLINVAVGGSITTDAIKTLLGFSLIRFLPMLLSLTLLMSVLLTLSRWYRDSEMVVWFSSGMSISKWIRPVLQFAMPIILLIAVLSLFVSPWASEKSLAFKDQLEAKDELATITPGVFKESRNANRVFFIESFDELGNVVKNIFVQSVQHERLGVITAATGHREVKNNGDTYIVMLNGRRYEGKSQSTEFSSTQFQSYAVRIESAEVKKSLPGKKSTSTIALLNKNNAEYIAELQSRISMPIAAFILVLMAIPLSFVDPRAGRSANLMMAAFIFIIYNNLLSVMETWVSQHKVTPLIGLWPVHLLFLSITIYMFYRRTFQLPLLPNMMKWFRK